MKYQIVFLSEAVSDLTELVDQLRVVSPVTVVKLQQELFAIQKQLEQFPFAYQASPYGAIRRAFIHTTHHALYFRVQGLSVEIIAILSHRIDPKQAELTLLA